MTRVGWAPCGHITPFVPNISHHSPSLQVGGPCLQDDRRLRGPWVIRVPFAPQSPLWSWGGAVVAQPIPTLPSCPPTPRRGGCRESGWRARQGPGAHPVAGGALARERLNISLWIFLAPLRFPSNLLFTSASGELWKMVRIGGQPLGFGEPCGVQRRGVEALPSACKCRGTHVSRSHSLPVPWGTDGETEAWGA